ncbi:MAG TPA: T9SS type A sorting domain-containing protein [Cyclobacteriaceae bacterium]|nr:T9SS type A sorting domain-containing protein [Cyclobacteriaceae bacterium]
MTPYRAILSKNLFIVIAFFLFGTGYSQTQPRLIGTSTFGGGSIFSNNLDGSGFATHKTFYPEGDVPTGLIDGHDGFFYGMTSQGGSGAVGVIYKIKPDGSQFSIIHDFQGSDGSQPAGKLMMASNGFLYGMTQYGGISDKGVIFRVSPDGSGFQILKHLSDPTGMYPEGTLVEPTPGTLIGAIQKGGYATGGFGVIFSIKLDGSNYTLLHVFNESDGGGPVGKLLQLSDGLYGMTRFGGANHVGTIFKVQSDGSGFATLFSFDLTTTGFMPFGDLILGLDNQLYGMTQNSSISKVGTIFKIGRDGGGFNKLRDYNSPIVAWDFQHTSLVQDANGILYGTALSSLSDPLFNNGVLFKMNSDGSGYLELITASTPANTDFPTGELMIDANGILYGVKKGKAVYADKSDGSRVVHPAYINPSKIFSFNPSNLVNVDLKSFVSPDGGTPRGDLVSGNSDVLFGTTFSGGLSDRGVLYSINSSGSNYQPLYHFSESTGGGPLGPMYRSPSGDIYGTTSLGGSFGQGVLYRVHEDGSSYTVLYNFSDQPTGLTYYNGDFFGTTAGSLGLGHIFKVHTDGSAYTSLHTFSIATGLLASGPVTIGPDGTLYGMTSAGGSNDYGVIYSIASDGSNYTVLFEFDGNNGRGPLTSLLYGADGTLFGMSYGDLANTFHSQIFNIYTDGTNFRQMAGATGNAGVGNLIQAPSGELYGTMHSGMNAATGGTGNIFQINIEGIDFQSIHDLSWSNGIPLTTLKYADVPIEDQTISFNPLPAKNYGDLPFQLTGTSTSGLQLSYTSSDPSVATIVGNIVTIVGVGSTAITASQAGNGIFNPAVDVPQTLLVSKGNQLITFNPFPIKAVNDPPIVAPATVNSGLAITYVSSNPAVATVSGQTITITGIGTTDITASQPGNSNYNAAVDVTQTLQVDKANQVITFNPLASKAFGDPPFNLTATSSSGLPVSYISTDLTVATVSGSTVTIVGGGVTTFIASQAGNAIFNPASTVTQTMTVTKVNQTITFNPLATKTVADVPFDLTATASSGLVVSYASSNPAVATVSGKTVTITGSGVTTITASQSGSTIYNPASDVTQNLTVTKANQTINFPAVAARTLGDAPFTLTATASSNLTVVFSTASDKISIAGNQATILKSGSLTVKADQSGNANYNAAPQQSQTFCINPPKPVVTTSGSAPNFTLTSNADTGNQWYLGGIPVTSGTGKTLVPIINGSYSVTVTVEGCASLFSDAVAIIVTGDLNFQKHNAVQVYPNPAKEEVIVSLEEFDQSTPVHVILYDFQGRRLEQKQSQGQQVNLDVRAYPAGTYVIRASQQSISRTAKFVKE